MDDAVEQRLDALALDWELLRPQPPRLQRLPVGPVLLLAHRALLEGATMGALDLRAFLDGAPTGLQVSAIARPLADVHLVSGLEVRLAGRVVRSVASRELFSPEQGDGQQAWILGRARGLAGVAPDPVTALDSAWRELIRGARRSRETPLQPEEPFDVLVTHEAWAALEEGLQQRQGTGQESAFYGFGTVALSPDPARLSVTVDHFEFASGAQASAVHVEVAAAELARLLSQEPRRLVIKGHTHVVTLGGPGHDLTLAPSQLDILVFRDLFCHALHLQWIVDGRARAAETALYARVGCYGHDAVGKPYRRRFAVAGLSQSTSLEDQEVFA